MNTPNFLAIVGPTASGKTDLSLEVGRRLGGEVVSMDSRQVYRGMDVGTGKVTLRERALLPHHGLDLLEPNERYSAGQFARDAREWIRGIQGRGRVPLLVGGTGFFLRALIQPMFSEPELDGERLGRLRLFLNGLPGDELREFAKVLDPRRAELAADGGKQRLTRTVEMALLTGRSLSDWHSKAAPEAVAPKAVAPKAVAPKAVAPKAVAQGSPLREDQPAGEPNGGRGVCGGGEGSSRCRLPSGRSRYDGIGIP